MTQVVAGVLARDGKTLICQRRAKLIFKIFANAFWLCQQRRKFSGDCCAEQAIRKESDA